MNSKAKLVSILLSVILLNSCSNDVYISQSANLLILEDKKEAEVAISPQGIQLAYSPIKYLGLKADGFFGKTTISNDVRRSSMGTLGIGTYFFHPLIDSSESTEAKHKNKQNIGIGIDLYLGATIGKRNTKFDSDSKGRFETNFTKRFIQSQIFWQTKKASFIFAIRALEIGYRNSRAFGPILPSKLNSIEKFIGENPYRFLEFDLKYSLGNKKVQSYAAISWSGNNAPRLIQGSNIVFSIGLDLHLNQLFNF